ncbi:MAG TPA: DNA recombination protein RmuC [Bryobacteraceae bacterium]|nr:DNA recombination protein RmuC [Bryobacteraceae bacterium]
MDLLTFLAGFVLAAMLAAALGLLLARLRQPSPPAPVPPLAAELAPPLAEALARIETQLREFESRERHILGSLDASLAAVGRDTAGLAQAMRGVNARGRWGELTLRRVAELAGMSPHCDFVEQVSAGAGSRGDGEDSRLRPDMLVRLPGGRTLAVDAKTPLGAYLDAEAAADAAARQACLDRHAQQLSRHVNELASREYWTQFDTAPEMVVLFLPGEHFLGAALERDRDLLDRALAKKVLIATPVSLVSVLKGAAFGWRERRLTENAEELRRIAGEFHERLRGFAEFHADSGRHLARAVEAYNKSAASWEARLLPSLRRVRELGVGGVAEPPQPKRIDTAVRELAPLPPDPPPPLPSERLDPRA